MRRAQSSTIPQLIGELSTLAFAPAMPSVGAKFRHASAGRAGPGAAALDCCDGGGGGSGGKGCTSRRVLARIVAMRLSAIIAAAFLLTSCTSDYDAYFVNPCSVDLQVSTHYDLDGRVGSVIAKATVRAEDVTKVEDALNTAAGSAWLVRIEGATRQLTLDRKTDGKWVVVIPSTICRQVRASAEDE